MRPGHSNPFPPRTGVKLGAPLSLGPGSGCSQKALKRSALMWFSEWLLNWQYLVLCFLDAGFKGAGCFSALSQMSLKGLEITEADALPVRLLGTEELCAATRHCFQNHQASNKQRENLGHTFQFLSYRNRALYVKLSRLSAWAICPFK